MSRCIFCLLLLTTILSSKAQYVRMTSAGYEFKGILADTLNIPTGCDSPTIQVNIRYNHSAIYFDSCNKGFWVYDPAVDIWLQLTASDSLAVRYDSVFIYTVDSIFIETYNKQCHDTTFQIYPAIGSSQYQNAVLVNNGVHWLSRNRLNLIPVTDYGFNWTTGTILFSAQVNPGENFVLHMGCFPDSLGYSDTPPTPPPPPDYACEPPPTSPPPDDPGDSTNFAPGVTRFGAALISGTNGALYTTTQSITVANSIGLRYVRGSTPLSTYAIQDRPLDQYIENGYKVVWNMNWQNGGTGKKFSTPAQFANKLTEVLTKYAPYLQNGVIAIEDEADNTQRYNDAISNYLNVLDTAVDVAVSFGVPVTNSGEDILPVYYEVAKYFRDNGLTDSLTWWTNQTFRTGMIEALNGANNAFAAKVRRHDTAFAAYAAMEHLTYINYHIYYDATFSSNPVNTLILRYVSRWVYDNSGKIFISNEAGQRNEDSPETVERMLTAAQANRIPFFVWFSGGATSLSNDNLTLRANGIKFRDVINPATP